MLNKNYLLVEPFPTIVDEVFERLNSDIHATMDLFGQQEYGEVNEKLAEHSEIQILSFFEIMEEQPSDPVKATSSSNTIALTTDDDINESIRSLNTQQKEAFNVVYKWS